MDYVLGAAVSGVGSAGSCPLNFLLRPVEGKPG